MSADSPRRGIHKGLQIISPQPVSDKSIIDSVAGIINDIVPQAYSGGPNLENKESISWARFEYADINDPSLISDYVEGSSTPPLLLVLGYSIGVQVWLISASGEATSVLSWRQNIVRTLRILPNPKNNDDDNIDLYEQKRPLIAICDSTGTGLQFCNVNFISLKTGEQLKSIKFKNPVCDILANKRSIVVSFSERIAVFDAKTFEDILTVTTCYPSPGPNPNPIAIGTRWLAYSEKKLIPTRRSSGGSEGEGVQSYTATVLYAAKSLGKGLRGLGETVASSLTGNSATPMTINSTGNDLTQPGVVTILDLQAAKREKELDDPTIETVVAHFTAHNDAIVAMTFDSSGSVLMTADKRGHDFHIFKIQPHPGGPTLAAVHHLYVLHRGDTTAKVQDMVFSSDSRWAAVSTVRGTTHVFPVAPYGGPVGMRTHSTAHVVNRLSRFHKSAGLTDDGTRSHSPVSHNEIPISVYPYSNPRLPPYPHPIIIHPLAQIRQPSTLNHVNNQSQQSKPQRQRLHSDDNGGLPLKICACFAPSRAWIYNQRDSSSKNIKKTIDSLFIMACHGNMIQYDLEPKPATGIPKEKICDDTMIELEVEAKGQWPLLRTQNGFEIIPPLSPSNPLLCFSGSLKHSRAVDSAEDRWLSQVEIVTHAGPHRRLWMGPQFVFKTYNATSGANVVESETVEVGVIGSSRPARSNPVNMPHAATTRPLMPVIIDGSGSSYEQSPRFIEAYGDSLENDGMVMGNGENQLREDLAEAMLETSTVSHRTQGRRLVVERVGQPVTKVVNPLGTVITILADEEDATSSLEFDDGQENIPEGRKSICAEVGPTSFNDFDSEGIPLPTLTEICAEMRSANEPIIDNIPDENIKDIKEEKTLCVESSSINTSDNAIDFEKVEAFHDISTNLSLCVEKGEIPNSPMSQARESSWNKLSIKNDKYKLNEKTCIKNAKYVVNYDDDNVVLMENKAAKSSPSATATKIVDETSKNICQNQSTSSSFANAQMNETNSPKYLFHEHEDSVVIEDTTTSKSQSKTKLPNDNNYKKLSKNKKSLNLELKDTNDKKLKKDVTPVKLDSCKAATPGPSSQQQPATGVIDNSNVKTFIDSFVELKDVDILVQNELINNINNSSDNSNNVNELIEPMEATAATTSGIAALPTDQLPFDDINCMDYHIVDTNIIRKDNNVQSDDDIEHINDVELVVDTVDLKLNQCEPITNENTSDLSINQRKNSKSTISDDDIEHINPSELTEMLTEKNKDIEIISHSDSIAVEDKSEVLRPSEETVVEKLNKKTVETDKIVTTKQNKGSRKRKDVVIIDSGPTNDEVTVIVKPPDKWSDNKQDKEPTSRSNDLKVPEQEEKMEETSPSPSSSQSLPRKTRVKTGKTSSVINQKPSSSSAPSTSSSNYGIEIIDIDAMQKAEMQIATKSECKIIDTPCQETLTIGKMKKTKRNKDTIKINDDNIDSTKGHCSKKDNAVVGGSSSNNSCKYSLKSDDVSKNLIDDDKLSEKCVQNDTVSITNVACENSKMKKISSPNDQCLMLLYNNNNKKDNDDNNKKDNIKCDDDKVDEDIEKECELLNQHDTPEKSSSSDDCNVNVVPMDTEEDCSIIKDKTLLNNEHPTPSWLIYKKANRSKKKKRR